MKNGHIGANCVLRVLNLKFISEEKYTLAKATYNSLTFFFLTLRVFERLLLFIFGYMCMCV